MVEVPVEVWGRVEGQSVVNVIIFCHIDRPKEVKWQLMIASCYRRSGKICSPCQFWFKCNSTLTVMPEKLFIFSSGNYQQALETYKSIHRKFPENIECKYTKYIIFLHEKMDAYVYSNVM
jgi:hypothetical protein